MNSYDPTIRMNLYEKVTSLRWEAVAAGTASSNASNVMSSFTFTISADYGSSGYSHHTATHCNTLQQTQGTTTRYSIVRHAALHCNTLQPAAQHCDTLQQPATH